jgi:coatomer subunit beta
LVTYPFAQKKAAEKRELEAAKQDVVRVDDLLTFRQFTKKAADDVIDVRISRSGLKRCHSDLTDLTV